MLGKESWLNCLLGIFLTVVTLCSCTAPNGILQMDESKYAMGDWAGFGTNLRVYHAAIVDPAGVHLERPGYVIGVEQVGGYFGVHQVTHIVSYDRAEAAPDEPPSACILTSLLWPDAKALNSHQPISRCEPGGRSPDYSVAFARSPNLVDFEKSLTRRLESRSTKRAYTQIFVVVMGWNTEQDEAIRNNNQLINNIAIAAKQHGKDFRPLVIAVTWPSKWALGDFWAVPSQVIRGLSFWAKKDQADDVGRRFLTHIVNDAVLTARNKVSPGTPVILIGHSFGARAFAAMFRPWHGPWYQRAAADTVSYTPPTAANWGFHPGDRLILLEGAFLITELFDEKTNDLLPVLRDHRLRVTMTSSIFDTAMATAIWGNYAGDRRTYAKVCGVGGHRFGSYDVSNFQCGDAVDDEDRPVTWGLETCSIVPEAKKIRWDHSRTDRMIHYLDASKLINCQTPFGGGGAHDDFNREEMGHFLWNEINSNSPSQGVGA